MISGPYYIYYYDTATFELLYASVGEVVWATTPTDGVYLSSTKNGFVKVYPTSSGPLPGIYGYEIRATVTASNGCSSTSYNSFEFIEGWSPSSFVYPNPASDIINVEIVKEAISKSNTIEQSPTDGNRIKLDPTYDIRLYDGQSNLLRQQTTKGDKIEFNVSNLSSGIYYLHIYDGVNSQPEIHQVVVGY